MSIHESNRAFKIELFESKPFQMTGALWRVLATGKETDGIVGALDERITHGLAAPMHSPAFFDPQFVTPNSFPLGIALQLYVGMVYLTLVALATWLALRRGASWVG